MWRVTSAWLFVLTIGLLMLGPESLAQDDQTPPQHKQVCPGDAPTRLDESVTGERPWVANPDALNRVWRSEFSNPLSAARMTSSRPSSKTGGFDSIQRLPGQDEAVDYFNSAMVTLPDGDVLVAYYEWAVQKNFGRCGDFDWRLVDPDYPPRLWVTRTTDGGETWSPPVLVAVGDYLFDYFYLSMAVTASGRILIADEKFASLNSVFYSDDNGTTWTAADRIDRTPAIIFDFNHFDKEPLVGQFGGEVWQVFYDESDGAVKLHRTADGLTWTEDPETLLVNAEASTSDLYAQGMVDLGDGASLLAAFQKISWDPSCCRGETVLSRSDDGGGIWAQPEKLDTGGLETGFGQLARSPAGRVWYVFQDSVWGHYMRPHDRMPLTDLYYMTSDDDGVTWTDPQVLTRYRGTDLMPAIAFHGEKPLITFSSNRFVPSEWVGNLFPGKGHIWIASPGYAEEAAEAMPPVVLFPEVMTVVFGPERPVRLEATVLDESMVSTVRAEYQSDDGSSGSVDMTRQGDSGVWVGELGTFGLGDKIDAIVVARDTDGNEAIGEGYVWDSSYPPVRPLRFYIEPEHTVGNIGLHILSSSIGKLSTTRQEIYEPDGHLFDVGHAAGSFGFRPLGSYSHEGPLGRWPMQDPQTTAYDYLFRGNVHVIIPSVGPFGVDFWQEIERPVQTTRGKCDAGVERKDAQSDQDFILRYKSILCDDPGLEVRQVTHQWSDSDKDDYITFDLEVTNTGRAGPLDSIFVTLHFDLDLHDRHNPIVDDSTGRLVSLRDDLLEYDRDEMLVFMHDSGEVCSEYQVECPPAWIGVSILPASTPGILVPECPWCWGTEPWEPGIDPRFDEVPHMPAGDHRFTIGVGPLDLDAEQDTTVSFGLVYGGSREELIANVRTMRTWYAGKTDERCSSTEVTERSLLPSVFALHPNYPNPFNPSTTIRFDTPHESEVSIHVFDMLGRRVQELVSRRFAPGRHEVQWYAGDLASGLYLVQMDADRYTQTQEVLLLR